MSVYLHIGGSSTTSAHFVKWKIVDLAKVTLAGLVIYFGIGLTLHGVFYLVDEMPPVPKSEAAKVVPGMSKAEVEALLGQPRRIRRSYSHGDGEYWTYKKPLRGVIFTVSFSGEGKVSYTGFDSD